MKQMFPRIFICVILIVLNGISDSLCKSVYGGAIQAMTTKGLLQDFNDLPQEIEKQSKDWNLVMSNFSIQLNVRQCPCLQKSIIVNTLDLWYGIWSNESVSLDFVLMDDCVSGCQLASLYGFMRTPTLVNGCRSELFSDRQVFPFMIRLTGTRKYMAQPIYEFMKNFGWKKVVIIYSYRDMINTGAMEIKRILHSSDIDVYEHQIDYYDSFTQPNDLTRMREAANYARQLTGSKPSSLLVNPATLHSTDRFLSCNIF